MKNMTAAPNKKTMSLIMRGIWLFFGRGAKVSLLLASATPSLETEYNIDHGKYERLQLTARIGGAEIPNIQLVDLRRHPPERQRWITRL